MTPAAPPPQHAAGAARQRGAVLFIVMVVLLLSTLLLTWASRAALFHERFTGNDADYQRAFEAAHAMLRDAQFDLLGRQADGTSACNGPGCRPNPYRDGIDLTDAVAQGTPFFPSSRSLAEPDGGQLVQLHALLAPLDPPCLRGICVATGALRADFWNDSAALARMKPVAALYGEFTGASSTEASGHPLLRVTAAMLASPAGRASAKAWYWIEPLALEPGTTSQVHQHAPLGGLVDSGAPGIAYRITAMAEGRRPATRAAVQAIVVLQETPVP